MPAEPFVVFDVDDTLYLERDYVASGFAAIEPLARSRFGVTGFAATAWDLFSAGARGDIFDRALVSMGVSCTPAEVASLVSAYRRHRPRIALLPDARAAVRGRPFALLTDGPVLSQANKIRALSVAQQASLVVLTGRYRGKFGKPHPRGFREIAERSGADRLAYVADNPAKDFAAPRALGWRTVRVRRRGGLHADVPHGDDVDVVVDDLSDLAGALR